ncbi:hypothetical protein Vretimale_3595 [Volvox reticuliferus]|uniref:DNA 3'-5' helicase n=1 Tax=Volvox reticuliferus TaxID=1737510 RepID=A0A8J4D9A6_9CHLO|nr:hypothetical protein Vretifemale_1147 [Volvox reticuliferus]GIL98160.1 hypothetical protein Vretimale_3595 [Volvox reticuliferus]
MAEVEDLTYEGGESDEGEPPLTKQLEDVEEELSEVKSQIEILMQQQDQLRARRDQLLRQIDQERRAPKADWRQENFPWSAKLNQILHDVFGLREFRPLQREVINAALQGRDVLCLLPSGGGKSLCYQLPALVSSGLTLVVSPLLSLIQDQVLSLRALGIDGACLTSLSSKEDVAKVYGKMDRGELKLLYVTPEKIVSSKRFMSKLEKVHQAGRLDRIAIDEAHCASAWGNDFRPDYKKLGVLKQQFPQVPILALTATATHQVCEDLKTILRISGCEFFRASVNRPNLFYEVLPKPAGASDATAAIVAWIRKHYPRGESGIVYCLTRKDCETVASELAGGGVPARHYHADMDPGPREAAHAAWSSGEVQVMVATVAFGMGINKPDVRFVVHHSLSKSLENYYQESGRAGRDGLPARCLMFYRFSDALRQAAIVCFEPTWQPNLQAMMAYAAAGPSGVADFSSSCRRAIIQRHFAEAPAECRCMCDNCCIAAGPVTSEPRDVGRHALVLLGILRQQQAKEKKATLIQLVDLWRSCKDPGVGKEAKAMSRDENEAVVAAMMYAGLLELEFGHTAYATNTYLRASRRGIQLVEASESGSGKPLRLFLPVSQAAAAAGAGGGTAVAAGRTGRAAAPGWVEDVGVDDDDDDGDDCGCGDNVLLSTLERWRAQKAADLHLFPHSILSAEQVVALSTMQPPISKDAFRAAVGVRRYELYGKELAEVLEGRYKPPPARPPPELQPAAAKGAAKRARGGTGKASTDAPTAAQQKRQTEADVVVLEDGSDEEMEETGATDAGKSKKTEKNERKGRQAAKMAGSGALSTSARQKGNKQSALKKVSNDSGKNQPGKESSGDEEDDDEDFETDVPLVKRRRD